MSTVHDTGTAPSGHGEAPMPPRVAVTGTAIGLLLMAVFTVAWTVNTLVGLPPGIAWPLTAAAVLAAAWFTVRGVRLLAARRRFPTDLSVADRARRRRSGLAFGIIFGAEGALIGTASALLDVTGHDDVTVPVIALIVGLHVYPMARAFGRRIDIYLATWTCLVALAGVLATTTATLSVAHVQAAVGIGTASATAVYGAFMARLGSRLLRS